MITHTNHHTGYIAIVGRPNVGKSTLLNGLIKQKISITSRKAQTTRYRINGILTDQQFQFIFVDTPGFQNQYTNQLNSAMNRVVTQSIQDVDIVLFVVEAMRFDNRDHLILKLLPANKPVILVINKIDKLADKKRLLPFLEEMSRLFTFAAIIPVSAAKKNQLSVLIDITRSYLPENLPLFDEDTITDRNERFHAAELLREKLFRLTGEEIPYSASVVIDQFKLDGHLRRISAAIIVEKANQKAIIIGKNGENLKAIATQARKDMERLFGDKVFLEVWVKIRNGWADNATILKTLGYD